MADGLPRYSHLALSLAELPGDHMVV